jgi:hypothetical protein
VKKGENVKVVKMVKTWKKRGREREKMGNVE